PEGRGEPRPARPTHVQVHLQRRQNAASDLVWENVPAGIATITQAYEGPGLNQPDLALWVGTVSFAAMPDADSFRLLIEEFEFISASYTVQGGAPGRLIYAEAFSVDAALVRE
ncbi:MAG TPA: hypothetical protein VM865_00640, partial [Acidobacteriaceae bacterium]|nr:hypothetical protein [Acidobacteriaceae bacterium]